MYEKKRRNLHEYLSSLFNTHSPHPQRPAKRRVKEKKRKENSPPQSSSNTLIITKKTSLTTHHQKKDEIKTSSKVKKSNSSPLLFHLFSISLNRTIPRLKNPQIHQPRPTIKFRIHRTNQPRALDFRIYRFHDNDACDLRGFLAGARGEPADCYRVAVVPGVVSVRKFVRGVFWGRTRGLVVQREWRVERIVLLRKRRESRRLLFRAIGFFYKLIKTSLSALNLSFFYSPKTKKKTRKKRKEKRKTYSNNRIRTTIINQFNHTIRIIHKIYRQRRIRQCLTIRRNEIFEIRRDALCVCRGHACGVLGASSSTVAAGGGPVWTFLFEKRWSCDCCCCGLTASGFGGGGGGGGEEEEEEGGEG